jgi:hypothetical protein
MQRVVRVLASLAIAIAGLAVHPGTVSAICMWLDPTPTASDVASTPVVFVGRVAFTTGPTAYFTVDEIWRGPVLPWLTTVYGGSGDLGEVIFEDDRTGWSLGARYLVLAGTGAGGKLLSGGCSPTRVYEPSFDALRPSDARLRYGTLQGAAVVVLVVGAVALAPWEARGRRPGRSRPVSGAP